MMFEPGDKVMRIGTPPKDRNVIVWPGGSPQFGRVYCVIDCWQTSRGPMVWLVGFGSSTVPIMNGFKTGWDARAFRKIEEIREMERRKKGAGKEEAQIEAKRS